MNKLFSKRSFGSSSGGVANIDKQEQNATWYYDTNMGLGGRQGTTGNLSLEKEEGRVEEVSVIVQNGVLSWLKTADRPSKNITRPAVVLQDARIKDLSHAVQQSHGEVEDIDDKYYFEVYLKGGRKFTFIADTQQIQLHWLYVLRQNSLLHLRENLDDLTKKLESSEAQLKETRLSLQTLAKEARDQKAMFHARKASIEHEKVVFEERWEETKQKEKLFEEAYREEESKVENLKNNLAEQEYQLKQQLADTKRKWTDNIRQIQEESDSRIQQLALESKDYSFRLEQAIEEIQGLRAKNCRLEEEVQKTSAEVMAAKSKLNLRENVSETQRKEQQQVLVQMKETLSMAERDNRELQAKSSSTERSLMRIEQARDALERELERRKSQLVTLQARERDAQKQAANLAGQLEVQREEQRRYTQSLKESVQEKDKQILDLHRRNGELEAHYELIKMELVSRDRLSRQNSDMNVEKMMELERQLNLSHQKIYELEEAKRGHNQQWDSHVHEIQADNARLKSKLKELDNALENQLAQLEKANELARHSKEQVADKDRQIEQLRNNVDESVEEQQQEIDRLQQSLNLAQAEADARIEQMKEQMEQQMMEERQLIQQDAENLMRESGDAQLNAFADLLLDAIQMAGYEFHQTFEGLTKHELYEEGMVIELLDRVLRMLVSDREDLRKTTEHLHIVIQQEREKSNKVKHDAMMAIQSIQGYVSPESAQPTLKNTLTMRRNASEKNVREQAVQRSKSRSRLSTPDMMIMEEDLMGDQKSRSIGSSTGRAEQIYTASTSHQLPPLGPPNASVPQLTPQKSPTRKSKHRKQRSQENINIRPPTPQEQYEEQLHQTVQAFIAAANKQDARRKSPLKKRGTSKKGELKQRSSKGGKSPSPSPSHSPSPPLEEHSSKARVGMETQRGEYDEEEIISSIPSKENLSNTSNPTQIIHNAPDVQTELSVESPPQGKIVENGEQSPVQSQEKISESSAPGKFRKKKSSSKERAQKLDSLEQQASSNLDDPKLSPKKSVQSSPRDTEVQQKSVQQGIEGMQTSTVQKASTQPEPQNELQRKLLKQQQSIEQVVHKKEALPAPQTELQKKLQKQLQQTTSDKIQETFGKQDQSSQQNEDKKEAGKSEEIKRESSLTPKQAGRAGSFGKFTGILQPTSSNIDPLAQIRASKKSKQPKPVKAGVLEDDLQKYKNEMSDLKVKLRQVVRRLKEPELSQEDIDKLKEEEASINASLEYAKENVQQTQAKIDTRDNQGD